MSELDRFSLPFEPDRPTYAHCAYCGDDVLSGHEAYMTLICEEETYLCGLYCAGEHAANSGRELDEYDRVVAGEE